MVSDEQTAEFDQHYRVPSSLMTNDPAYLGRWFCACGAMLARVPTFDEALRLHLNTPPGQADPS